MHALLCFGDWVQHGLVKDVDIKAAALLLDVIGKEAELVAGWDDIVWLVSMVTLCIVGGAWELFVLLTYYSS